ncbi:unnamed protein product [Arabidopsis arenosa]|uniref:Pentatricopeptide repeat-containing protein n=1 Tax=Arabidopsis arenosa TaxID=38785 RepID=A0A8S2A9F5_ARAAE|nr:unnamed protein product [Arabidopsis arenosa]
MITKRGMAFDLVLSTSLIDMYAKAGDITSASCVFNLMPMKNPASWNSMIGDEFKKLIERGYKPDQVTFTNLLSACAHAGLVEEGEKQFMLMSRLGIAAEKEHYAYCIHVWSSVKLVTAEGISRLRREHPAAYDDSFRLTIGEVGKIRVMRIAKDPRFERLPCVHKGTYADDCLVDRVTQHKCFIVATCDRDLKRRIRKIPGVPIMYVTRRKYSIEKLPEATLGGAPRY